MQLAISRSSGQQFYVHRVVMWHSRNPTTRLQMAVRDSWWVGMTSNYMILQSCIADGT